MVYFCQLFYVLDICRSSLEKLKKMQIYFLLEGTPKKIDLEVFKNIFVSFPYMEQWYSEECAQIQEG